MIIVENLWKTYVASGQEKIVARGINLEFPQGRSIALLGQNGAGKSTFLRMISGAEPPDYGTIKREGSVSWPIGFAGSFHPDLTGAQNIRFVARVYGVDSEDLVDFVEEFAQLGSHFHAPFRTYSSGMKARLGFGVSMGIDFDVYLIDEVTAVGDADFRRKSLQMLNQNIGKKSAIIVSHSMQFVKGTCDGGVVFVNGSAKFFNNVERAITVHEDAMSGKIPNWAK